LKNLFVIGGQQKKIAQNKDEWHQFKKGIILQVNVDTGQVKLCVDYISPPDVCPEKDSSVLFKCGSLQNNKLYVCTQTEVLIYELPNFRKLGYVSLPCLNDVHHVRPVKNGELLIVNTGLDTVLKVTLEGKIVNEWNVLGENTWDRFSKDIDYRKVATTKPHKSHPNYVFELDDDIWVTRFEQKDALCLTYPGKRIEIGIERPHDGIVQNGFIYFTTIDGHLVIVEQNTLKINDILDLNLISNKSESLGWCRGLLIDNDKLWVGFSRIRPTKFKENISWVKHGFKKVGIYNTLPTRIACYDIVKKDLLQEINLEKYGLNAIFSILPGDEK